jgi:hypothetical protein
MLLGEKNCSIKPRPAEESGGGEAGDDAIGKDG